MKQVTYKKKEIKDQGRVVSIRERHEDKDCVTRVLKDFVYLVSHADMIPKEIDPPEVIITKKIDSSTNVETFVFRVKGELFVREKRFIYRIQYCHGLRVQMFWKKSHVLPSSPAALA